MTTTAAALTAQWRRLPTRRRRRLLGVGISVVIAIPAMIWWMSVKDELFVQHGPLSSAPADRHPDAPLVRQGSTPARHDDPTGGATTWRGTADRPGVRDNLAPSPPRVGGGVRDDRLSDLAADPEYGRLNRHILSKMDGSVSRDRMATELDILNNLARKNGMSEEKARELFDSTMKHVERRD